jgi:hypothetical protein
MPHLIAVSFDLLLEHVDLFHNKFSQTLDALRLLFEQSLLHLSHGLNDARAQNGGILGRRLVPGRDGLNTVVLERLSVG